MYEVTSSTTSPVLDGLEEHIHDLIVIDKVQESEAGMILIPGLIGSIVDDPGYTTDDLISSVRQEVCCIAELKGGILIPVQGHELFIDKRRHMVWIVFVEIDIECHKIPQERLVLDPLEDDLLSGHGTALEILCYGSLVCIVAS